MSYASWDGRARAARVEALQVGLRRLERQGLRQTARFLRAQEEAVDLWPAASPHKLLPFIEAAVARLNANANATRNHTKKGI